MKKTRNIALYILGRVWLLCVFSIQWAGAQDFYYDYNPWNPSTENTNIGEIIKDDAVTPQSSILYRLRQAFKLTGWIYEEDKTALAYIKMVVNIMLGLVGFIALILVIYAFYLMFFSEQEEGLTKAKKILKGVWIAITIMFLSYFIVSFIYFVYGTAAGTAGT